MSVHTFPLCVAHIAKLRTVASAIWTQHVTQNCLKLDGQTDTNRLTDEQMEGQSESSMPPSLAVGVA